jgi:hypothetical protein
MSIYISKYEYVYTDIFVYIQVKDFVVLMVIMMMIMMTMMMIMMTMMLMMIFVYIQVEDFAVLMAGLQLPYPKKIDASMPANLKCGII